MNFQNIYEFSEKKYRKYVRGICTEFEENYGCSECAVPITFCFKHRALVVDNIYLCCGESIKRTS